MAMVLAHQQLQKLPHILRYGLFFLGFSILGSSCAKVIHQASFTHSPIVLDERVSSDAGLDSLISPFRARLAEEMEAQVGKVDMDLFKGQPESTMGNMLADLMFECAIERYPKGADAVVLNINGLRQPKLAKGPLTVGMCYELLPFDNTLVVVTLDSSGMGQLAQAIAKLGGWPISANMTIVINDGKATSVTLKGQTLSQGRAYRIAMPDYLANGGDGLAFLRTYPQENQGDLLRDLFMEKAAQRFEMGLGLHSALDGRITLIPH